MSVFTVNRKQLQVELGLLVSVLARKPTIPVLESVRLEWAANLTLTASSLDITMVSQVDLPWEVGDGVLGPETDTFCLPLRELHRLVSLFESEEVAFTVDRDGKGAGRILVQGGKSKHKLPFWEGGEYPEFDQVANPQTFTVESGLIAAIARVIPCAASEDNYPTWQYGVHVEGGGDGVTLAATDNHRLGFETVAATAPAFSVVVPAVGMKPLLAMEDGPVAIEVNDSRVSFALVNRKLITGLLTATFPSWRPMVPNNQSSIAFDNKQAMAALKRIAVTRDETRGSGVKVTFASDLITIQTNTPKGESVETVEATGNLNGDSLETGLNPDYLAAYLAGAGERVSCALQDGAPLLFSEADSNFQCVIMRMRIT